LRSRLIVVGFGLLEVWSVIPAFSSEPIYEASGWR
jgi:hypothetical protein